VLATRNIFTQREGDPKLLGSTDEDHEEAKASIARLEGLGELRRAGMLDLDGSECNLL